jgi:hypothetical protein
MMVRTFLALLTIATSAYAQHPPNPPATAATILQQEQLFWTSYTTGNTAALRRQLLPEFQSVEQEIWGRDQVLRFVADFTRNCSLAPVKILDPHIEFLSPTAATIVYHAIETPTCGGQTLSGETNISTVWLLRPAAPGEPARWQMHLHTEYAVPPQ